MDYSVGMADSLSAAIQILKKTHRENSYLGHIIALQAIRSIELDEHIEDPLSFHPTLFKIVNAKGGLKKLGEFTNRGRLKFARPSNDPMFIEQAKLKIISLAKEASYERLMCDNHATARNIDEEIEELELHMALARSCC